MAASRVRTHTRRTADGQTTTVHQHSRTGRGRRRRGLVSPRHAWKLLQRAFGAGRRRKRLAAVVLVGLAAGELAAWLTLRGLGLVLVTAGLLAIGCAIAATAAAGGELR